MEFGRSGRVLRLRRMARMPLVSPRLWWRRVVFWGGAVLVAAVAVGFAKAADLASGLFLNYVAGHAWLPFIVAPAGLAIAFLLTRHVFPGAQGSGIPQTIAALHMHDQDMVDRVLSPRIAVGKVLLTLLGLASGASIGREGPTAQVGASIMHALGKLLRLPRLELSRALVLAGGAAGVAAAFNTPLAGVVFAIEELSHSFEARTSGTVFTAVVVAGATTLGLVGNYTYFGHTSAALSNQVAWLAVILCSVTGGLLGGLFSQALIVAARGLPGWAGRMIIRYPVGFAALCGLLLAVIGFLSGGQTYGTGYAQAEGDGRGPFAAAGGLCAAEAGGDGGVVCQRHSGRYFRAVAVDRRGDGVGAGAAGSACSDGGDDPAGDDGVFLRRGAGADHLGGDRDGDDGQPGPDDPADGDGVPVVRGVSSGVPAAVVWCAGAAVPAGAGGWALERDRLRWTPSWGGDLKRESPS